MKAFKAKKVRVVVGKDKDGVDVSADRAEGAEDTEQVFDTDDGDPLFFFDHAPPGLTKAKHVDIKKRDHMSGKPRILAVGLCGWSGYHTVNDDGEVVPCDEKGEPLGSATAPVDDRAPFLTMLREALEARER